MSINIDGRIFEVKPVKGRENIHNPEVAKFVARTHNRSKDFGYVYQSQQLKNILSSNFPDLTTSDLADFYIPSKKLHIDDRTGRNHNYNLFKEGNGIQRNLLNKLIEENEVEFIKQWCITDPEKSEKMDREKIKYLEIYSFQNEADVLTQIRRVDTGLKIEYSQQEMINELKNIFNRPSDFSAGCSSNRISVSYCPHFYQGEQNLYQQSKYRRLIIENLLKYLVREYEAGGEKSGGPGDKKDLSDGEILRQYRISRIENIGFSMHSPHWCKAFIEKYGIKSVYDPCGGWLHRLIASFNISYIFNDIDQRNVDGAKKFCEDFKDINIAGFTLGPKYFYNEDAAKLTPKEDYDCILSCPPYFDTELYLNENTSTTTHPTYDNWLNNWWYNVVKSSLKDSVKYFAFIINKKYLEDMKNVCLRSEFKLEFVEEIPVNKETAISHLNRRPSVAEGNVANKSRIMDIKKGEVLLVFKRII